MAQDKSLLPHHHFVYQLYDDMLLLLIWFALIWTQGMLLHWVVALDLLSGVEHGTESFQATTYWTQHTIFCGLACRQSDAANGSGNRVGAVHPPLPLHQELSNIIGTLSC